MDLFKDIGNLMKNNTEHNLKIEVSWDGVRVYLDYDPDKEFKENCIIPIYYSVLEDICYIPDSEYRDKFEPCDTGITYEEIILIKDIMDYLVSNEEEIHKLCEMYDLEFRQEQNKKENNMVEVIGDECDDVVDALQ